MLKLVRCELALENWERIVCSLSSVARGITVWQMRQISPETNRMAVYRGLKYEVHLPVIAVEIVTDDSWLADIIARVTDAHKEGRIIGRALLQVLPVEGSYRIRDGFMDL
jgi:nitrogen regulatory protein PII